MAGIFTSLFSQKDEQNEDFQVLQMALRITLHRNFLYWFEKAFKRKQAGN
ncbi:hypothetical protein [Segetibacter koreensis]|nr:hypothetical protein [Segetibacter koreensis]